MRTRIRTTMLIATIALLGAACSSADVASEAVSDPAVGFEAGDGMAGGEEVDGDAFAAPDDVARAVSEAGANDVVTFGGSGAAVGRELARTASLIVEVADLEQAAAKVSAAASGAGGFIAEANVRGGEFGYGVLTLRVPAAALDATVRDLADVGVAVIESSITTEDLTEQLTDLGARIANLQRLEAELQDLLADVRNGASSSTEIINVFDQLNDVRGQIERLQATQAGARDRVQLATINVELVPTAVAPEPLEVELESTLARAWQTTKDAFTEIGDAAIWLGVTILPILLTVVGIPLLVVWMLARAIVRRRRESGGPAGAPVGQPYPHAPAAPAQQPVMAGAPAPTDADATPAPPADTPDA